MFKYSQKQKDGQWSIKKCLPLSQNEDSTTLSSLQIENNTSEKQLNLQFFLFLYKFYNDYKKSVKFFPPKLAFHHLSYNKKKKKYQVNDQYILVWCSGMIEEPLTLQQRMCAEQTQDTCIFKKYPKNQQERMHNQDPLIYLNPLILQEQEKMYQNFQILSDQKKKQFLIAKNQPMLLSFRERLINKLIEYQIQKKFYQEKQVSFKKNERRAQIQLNNSYLPYKKRVKIINENVQKWLDFSATYNFIMVLYNKAFKAPYQISSNDVFKIQNPSQSYEQTKLKFALQCYKEKEILWDVLFELFQCFTSGNDSYHMSQVKKHKLVSQPLSLQILHGIFTQQYEANWILGLFEKCYKKYSIFLKFLMDQDLSLMNCIHNPLRYLFAVMIVSLNYYQIDILQCQIRQKYKKNNYLIQKVFENKMVNDQSIIQYKKKMSRYFKKGFQKLKSYQADEKSTNYTILVKKAGQTYQFALQQEQIVKKLFSQKKQDQIKKYPQKKQDKIKNYSQVLSMLIDFCQNFILTAKSFRARQTFFQQKIQNMKTTKQYQNQQFTKFIAQNGYVNYFLVQLLLNLIQFSKCSIFDDLQQLLYVKQIDKNSVENGYIYVKYNENKFAQQYQNLHKIQQKVFKLSWDIQKQQKIQKINPYLRCLHHQYKNKKLPQSYFGLNMYIKISGIIEYFEPVKSQQKNNKLNDIMESIKKRLKALEQQLSIQRFTYISKKKQKLFHRKKKQIARVKQYKSVKARQ